MQLPIIANVNIAVAKRMRGIGQSFGNVLIDISVVPKTCSVTVASQPKIKINLTVQGVDTP